MLTEPGKKLWAPRSAWLERSAPTEKDIAEKDDSESAGAFLEPAPPAACYCGGDTCYGLCEIEKARNRQ